MTNCDALIVGCGLSGAVVARILADNGKKVTVLERRDHIGGNMFDYVDEHGILVHKYGPHTFHTCKDELFDFMSKYGEWTEYHLTCGAEINGHCVPTPFNFETVDTFFDKDKASELKKRLVEKFPNRETVTVVEALSCDDELVREYAQFLFDNDYSLYTAKQWGVPATEIDPSVLKRVPLRLNYNIGYFDDKYQVMPKVSYTKFFDKLLNHPNITVKLSIDALEHICVPASGDSILLDGERISVPVIYTGALDELFGLKYGRLPYRSLRFDWKYEEIDSKQDMPVVAYPQADGYTRIVEYKKLPVQNVKGTSYEVEYSLPYEKGKKQEPYYPVLTEESKEQYSKYLSLVSSVKNLFLCGRLADFKYYNMDQALEKAIDTANTVLNN